MGILRTKSIEQSIADTDEGEHSLKKGLSALDLTVFGIGVVIGAGIFTLTGRAANTMAGPGIVISFVVAAIGCALAALCYAEFASTVPVAGSAYTFSYASLGEFIAWVIGWDLLLEMMLGASVVSQGWSAYFTVFMKNFGINIPTFPLPWGQFDPAAALLVVVLGCLVAYGVKESLRVNMVLVAVKLFIVIFVIVAGLFFINPANYDPFIPAAQAVQSTTAGIKQPLLQALFGLHPTAFGWGGVLAGAGMVFFAYIGFDVVATTAEEAKNPQRDLPIGIIASLIICTLLYAAVSLVVTGMVKYDQLNPKAALAEAFMAHGQRWAAQLISAGAVAGLTTVVLTLLTGSTRILFAMSRDRLLPGVFSKVSASRHTPVVTTACVTILCAIVAGATPVGELEEMVNIGTLSAFVLVSLGVIVLRRSRPDLKRPFRVPLVPVLPILAALVCLLLMMNLSLETWYRFLIWLVIGCILYGVYGYWHSRVRQRDLGNEAGFGDARHLLQAEGDALPGATDPYETSTAATATAADGATAIREPGVEPKQH